MVQNSEVGSCLDDESERGGGLRKRKKERKMRKRQAWGKEQTFFFLKLMRLKFEYSGSYVSQNSQTS